MYKKCQVVMLPTNQKAIGNIEYFSTYDNYQIWEGKPSIGQQQHLYILSGDKIEVGDWVYSPKGTPNIQYQLTTSNKDQRVYGWSKIIASTNPTLNRPSPSPEFLQIYCEKQPKEVLVKYEDDVWSGKFYDLPQITNNQISIKKLKQSYTREEVEAMFDIIRSNDNIRLRGFDLNSLLK